MTILSAFDPLADRYDTCVVGAGPVGLALAMEAADAGLRVLLLDAGTQTSGRRDVAPPEGGTEIVDPARHAPLDLTTRQGVGGTSWLWGGRCVAFEPIDFTDRDYVPDGRWPIGIDDVAPWYPAAAAYLDCGAAVFRSQAPDWPGLADFTMSNLERWSRQPRLAPALGARVLAHPRIGVLLDARVVDVEITPAGTVEGLRVDHRGTPTRVEADSYVLAMGGLEVTRFLLAKQAAHPELFGGADGPLGRYYMGHATGAVASIVLTDPRRAADLDFVRDEHDTYVRRRFSLTEPAQRRHRVLNTSFYLDNPPFYEAEHRNATLSLVFLGLRIPAVGKRLIAEGIRLRHIGPPPYRVGAHLANILRKPWRAAADVLDILRRRYLSKVRSPGFILRNDAGRYALHYHAEQVPNPDSRVSLVAGTQGSPILRIDYRYLEQDIDSLLRCHELLDAELRAAGLGRLEYLAPTPDAVRELAWDQATDGFHSIGTTRMSDDPTDGVVDRDCRVHGTDNLYIASSSVFRTSAEANPTFFAACLAVRLAHHLDARYGRQPAAAAPAVAPSARAAR